MPEWDWSNTGRYQRPQFRNPDGGMNWWQVADMFIPGNIYNSQTNQFRPLGIAQGLTGIPVDTAVGVANRLRSPVQRGSSFVNSLFRRGPGDTSGLGPVRPSGVGYPTDAFGNTLDSSLSPYAQPLSGPPTDFLGNTLEQNMYNAPSTGPSLGGRNYTPTGGRGGTVSSQRGLGAGQLGTAGDRALQDYMRAFMSRGGALMEY